MTATPVETLRGLIDQMPERDRDFASSLCRQTRPLSDRQMYWVNRLIAQQQQRTAAPTVSTQVGNLSGVMALFERARQHLQHPAIVLQIDPHTAVRLTVAGPAARVPGSLNVTSVDHNGPRRAWFGRVVDGNWQPSASCTNADAIAARLVALAADPATVAAEYGHLHGSCCFCMRPLSDARSTTVGYGPICAGHYGLPWGEEAATPAPDAPAVAPRPRVRRRRRVRPFVMVRYTTTPTPTRVQEDTVENGFGEDL